MKNSVIKFSFRIPPTYLTINFLQKLKDKLICYFNTTSHFPKFLSLMVFISHNIYRFRIPSVHNRQVSEKSVLLTTLLLGYQLFLHTANQVVIHL